MDNYEAISLYEGECPGCGIEFIKKRSNQVYCNSRCKNQYHNGNSRVGRIATKERHEITREVDDILWKNREVLLKYVGEEKNVKELIAEGFKPNYQNYYENKDSKTYFFIYDVKFQSLGKGIIKIFQ